jgi:hypothetical protein
MSEIRVTELHPYKVVGLTTSKYENLEHKWYDA